MNVSTKTLAKIGLAVVLTYIAIYYWAGISGFLGKLLAALAPLVVGCVLAYIVNLIMSQYERIYFPKSQKKFVLKSRRPVCLAAALLSLVALITLIILLIIPQLVSCVDLLLFETIPDAIENVTALLKEYGIISEEAGSFDAKAWTELISDNAAALTTGLTGIVGIVVNVVTSVIGGLITAFVSVMFAIYLLLSKETLISHAKTTLRKLMSSSLFYKTKYVLRVANETFRGYIIGQCTEALILGVLCALGMWILGMPYYAMIGALIAFTALIPIAGAYIGGAIGAFMILTVDPIKAVIFVVFLVVLQQIEGNLIYPRVVGGSIGLPAIWVLVAVAIGGGTMGVLGMLLGVPVVAVIYKIIMHKLQLENE